MLITKCDICKKEIKDEAVNDILNLQKRVQILEKAVRAMASNQSPK